MEYLENHTFEEIAIGDTARMSRTLTTEDMNLFAVLSGGTSFSQEPDDDVQSTNDDFHKIVGSGVWVVTLITNLLGNQLPGPGTIYLGHTLNFNKAVYPGDVVTAHVVVREKIAADRRVIFDYECRNQSGDPVSQGCADVIAPTEKLRIPVTGEPLKLRMSSPGSQLQRLVDMTRDYEPIRMSVVHPVDQASLMGAVDACRAGLIIPVLVGPRGKILSVAKQEGVNPDNFEIVDAEHSHAAAVQAVAMARAGEVDAIMKGSLHTDEVMSAVIQRDTGIRTDRRMSHVFLMDVPSYPRPLMVTDAAININPSLEDKVDIVQNAIDLAHAMGNDMPRVALLSAVETVNPGLRSTLEASAICKMADRRQITGGIIDGPLAFDNAVSEKAARIKHIESEVAGRADILVAPDLESGNMLAKQLEYMADAQSSGIVLGARVPIALTSRADTVLSRMASCAIALLLARHKQKTL